MSYITERARPGREPVTILELYVPLCQLRYGETTAHGTCPAVLGESSPAKCYNTLATCPVPDSFQPADLVLRFSTAQQDIPPSAQIRPTIVDVDVAPRRLAPSKGLGEGAEARVTLLDHPWHDLWTDPYRDERDYDPLTQGTFWGKFLARNPYYRGIRMRLLTGYISPDGFSLDDFTAREYVVDAIQGPDRRDRVTVIGKDVFSLLEKERSVVPAPSTGQLAAAIDENATSFTLAPSGIGDREYPAEFRCVIGNEGFDVTRVGDVCTIVRRGLYRGRAKHEAEDSVQVVRRFVGQRIDQIAAAIITEAQPALAEYIPAAEWEAEALEYLPRLYEGDITKPTGVNELLAELMDSAPVMFWPNEFERRIEMRVIKPPPGSRPRLTDAEHFLEGSVEKIDRPKDRIDACLIHFGQLDPTADRKDASNYGQSFYLISPEAQARYGTQQLREVYSRWISRFNKAAAEDLARLYIRRYRETPVTLKFRLDAKHGDLRTGDLFEALTRRMQDVTGAPRPRNFQVIEVFEREAGHLIEYEAESYDWWIDAGDPTDPTDPTDEVRVLISLDDFNLNLRTVYDSLYATVAPKVRFVIEPGVIIGSASTALPAIDVGVWPEGVELRLENRGRIQGAGGRGGAGGSVNMPGAPGQSGGPALRTRVPIIVDNSGGEIWGGGGGGGGGGYRGGPYAVRSAGSGGGGGAGTIAGQGGAGGKGPWDDQTFEDGAPGKAGTATSGGAGGGNTGGKQNLAAVGGRGGDPGQPGQSGESASYPGGAGGAAGHYIDGNSFVIWESVGDCRGRVQ